MERSDNKEPKKPVKPPTTYGLYFEEIAEHLQAQVMDFEILSTMVAGMWNSLSDDNRQVYRDRTEAAKQRYLVELAEYRAKVTALEQEAARKNDEQSQQHKQTNSKPTSSPQAVVPTRIVISNQQISTPQRPIKLVDMVGRQGNIRPILIETSKGSCFSIRVIPSVSHDESASIGRQPILEKLNQENTTKSDLEIAFTDDHEKDQMIEADLRLLCKRDGCQKRALDGMDWGEGFCSSYCVAAYVRETFQKFLGMRTT